MNHDLQTEVAVHDFIDENGWRQKITTGYGWAWCSCGWGADPSAAEPTRDYRQCFDEHAAAVERETAA